MFSDLNAPHSGTPNLHKRLKPVLEFRPSELLLPRQLDGRDMDDDEAYMLNAHRQVNGMPTFAQLLRHPQMFGVLNEYVVRLCPAAEGRGGGLQVPSVAHWSLGACRRGSHRTGAQAPREQGRG